AGGGGGNNNRVGLALIAFVLSLYAFGLAETAWHLPSPNHRRRSWLRRLARLRGRGGAGGDGTTKGGGDRPIAGRNINLAKSGISDAGDDDGDDFEGEEADDAAADVDDAGDAVVGAGGLPTAPTAAADEGDDEAGADPASEKLAAGPADRVDGPIPRARWPISIRDEDGSLEEVVHPGHEAKGHPDVTMMVPRFWVENPPSVHRNKLMTRELAMKIGSCAAPDADGNYGRGDACPPDDRTIFVAIASYRDWQCRDTASSIFGRAKYPERVRVGVVDQIVEGEDGPCDAPPKPCKEDPDQVLCEHKGRLDVFQVDAQLSIGPVFARHLGHRMYRGEYYYMQSDAHVTFTRGWDVDIISQEEATKNEMAVLSTYLTDVEGSISKNGDSLRNTRPIMCNTDYEQGQSNRYLRHGSQPEAEPRLHGVSMLQPYWAAGFSFSRGHFVVNVPYDFYQPMIFQGEEMSIGIRGWTIGYDFYAPERSVCFHHYTEGKNKRARDRVPHYWENSNQYAGAGVKAMRTEHHLCMFVESGQMHNQFTKLLRKDGMGIDYGKIEYRFHDPVGKTARGGQGRLRAH
ncbi:hypothetical protein ACHAWF_017013, partial [Thalassiosira exigua]